VTDHNEDPQQKMPFLNAKRLRNYPRLMFFTTWLVLALNIIFRHGWLGGFGQIIGSDFITLYSSGIMYRADVAHLYDFPNQSLIQQELILPTTLPGLNPFISPPYVAAFYSLFTYIPLSTAFFLWSLLTILSTILAVYLLSRILPLSIQSKLSNWQLLIIVLSFFPFIEGLQVGQNHAFILLLATLVITFTIAGNWYLAGFMAGLMIFKPQMVLGFLIIWVIWKKYKAIAGFVLTVIIAVGLTLITNGIDPYIEYMKTSHDLLLLPYIQGFPGYLLLTVYGFLTSLFPIKLISVVNIINYCVSGVLLLGFVWLVFKSRNIPMVDRTPVIVLALLIPITATPYALLHDLVILIPAYILWARYENSRSLLLSAVVVYLGSFFLPLIASFSKIAWMSCLTLLLTVVVFYYIISQKKAIFLGTKP
jgi:alpha-1,2-mannosyltransferase